MSMREYDRLLVGSQWRRPTAASKLEVVSPSTEEVVGRVPEATPADVNAAVVSARRAFDEGPWPRMSIKERGEYLLRIVELLRPYVEEAAHVQVDEMGSPYSFALPNTVGILDMVASQVEMVGSIPTRMVREGSGGPIVVSREPIGVIGAIIPWNAPVPLIIARMLPALLTGSPLIVKPALESPLSAYIVGEAVVEAGLPEGILSLIHGDAEVGEAMVTHPGVDKISFTGSTAVGRRVAALCGERLKQATMELGGKSAAVVLEDADIDKHIPELLGTSMTNSGQICHTTSRILVPASRSKEMIDAYVGAVASMKVGDPHDPATRVGPLVSRVQRDRVVGYIESGRDQGVQIALGGGRPAGLDVGWYVEPTVFTHVDNSLNIAQEEIFGPVVCIIDYETEDQAVAIANDSPYGLGGGVFTEDIDRGLEVASRIRTGTCVINSGVAGGGGGPFGGMKASGLGRERGIEGYEAYYELKSVALPKDAPLHVS